MFRKDAAAGRALQKTQFQQIRFYHFFYGVAFFGKGCCQRIGTNWAAAVVLGDAGQIAAVKFVEPISVNIQQAQSFVGNFLVYFHISGNGAKIPHAF